MLSYTRSDSVTLFFGTKTRGLFRFILNLKALNTFIST